MKTSHSKLIRFIAENQYDIGGVLVMVLWILIWSVWILNEVSR